LDYKGGDGVIIGCSSLTQLESNLKDFDKGPLPEDVVTALDVLSLESDSALMSSKHGRLSNLLFRITGMLLGISDLLPDAENLPRFAVRIFYLNLNQFIATKYI